MDNLPAQQDSSDLTHALPPGMPVEEINFVYNVEVLGLPARKAASMAGMPVSRIVAPHIIQARELVKRELNGAMAITKEDIIRRMDDAVYRAQLLSEPMTEIIGLEKMAKLMGYDAPKKVDINVTASLDVLRENVKSMGDAELTRLIGAGDIIDAEFYEHGQEGR